MSLSYWEQKKNSCQDMTQCTHTVCLVCIHIVKCKEKKGEKENCHRAWEYIYVYVCAPSRK